jgi:hypothetical protein
MEQKNKVKHTKGWQTFCEISLEDRAREDYNRVAWE